MTVTTDFTELRALKRGHHVCWTVADEASYREGVAVLLGEARSLGEKSVLFGPEESAARRELAHLATASADPRTTVLGDGPLVPEAMYAMFHEQTELARAEGYARIRVVADMDWLLPIAPTPAEILAFELLLDHNARKLDATIVCAYRRDSFSTQVIAGAACVHPSDTGGDEPAQFRVVAGENGTWQLTGEVDLVVAEHFSSALAAVVETGDIDASGLVFMDVAGMRALANASRSTNRPIRVVGAPPILQRSWRLAGFAEVAPKVALVA